MIYKDAEGEFELVELEGEAADLGLVVAGLVGLAIEGEESEESPSDGHDGWDVLDDVPRDTAAALLLIEHHWAVPLREAIARAGGYRIGDGFISPLDLVEVGLVSAQGAEALHAFETGAT